MLTTSQLRLRLRIEFGLAIARMILVIDTVIWPNWIELLIDADPDGGNGSLERAVSLLLLLSRREGPISGRKGGRARACVRHRHGPGWPVFRSSPSLWPSWSLL